MRKPFLPTPIFILIFFLSFTRFVHAQTDTLSIVGPTEVCIGQCATYIVEGIDATNCSPNIPQLWFLSNGITLGTSGGTATGIVICWDQIIGFAPGVYTIYAEIDCQVSVLPLTVFVQDFSQPEIIPLTNSSCGVDSMYTGSDCQKACAFSTVTYYTPGSVSPPSNNLTWTVAGAEDYSVENNFITVTWGGPGQGYIGLFLDGICPGENSICVELLDEPTADFITQPPANAGVVSICEGQTVYFENQSLGAENYGWFFDVLGVSTEVDPDYTFLTPGSYEVSLVARNECGCSDTTSLIIEVEAAEPPTLDCVGAVCAGETVTYTTGANCTAFAWNVVGDANVLGGGGPADNFITIEWLDGPYGFIELDVSGCATTYCNSTLVERIPVMTPNAPIEGPSEVCRGETVTYAVPEYDGSSYVWTVSNLGQILSGQGTNQISVLWDGNLTAGLTQSVLVEYDNCFLECSGMSNLAVGILNEFYISGPILVCEGASTDYAAINVYPLGGMNWNWQVESTNGTVLWTAPVPSSIATVNWNFGPGKYRLVANTASPNLYCVDSYSITVDVKPLPGPPNGILGATLICPGTPYTYTVDSGQPNSTFTWAIQNGATVMAEEGSSIVLTWGPNPPYELEVTQTHPAAPVCASPPVMLVVQALNGLAVNGPVESCIESSSIFTADDIGTSDYSWSTIPADAGTVVSGAGTHEAEILWHISGPVTVQVSVCGQTASTNIDIQPEPVPDPLYPSGICQGGTDQVTTLTAFSSYQWRDENGVLLSTDPDPQLGPGTYEVVVTNAAGCEGNTSFTIETYPIPDVLVSTPDPTGYCTGHPPATLYATTTGSGYSYQWYYNGNPVGANSVSLVDMGYGNYWVEATDINGCTAVSNTLEVFEYCPPSGATCGGGCSLPGGGGGGVVTDCEPGTSVLFQILPPTSNCAEGVFEDISTDLLPGSHEWRFGDGVISTDPGPVVNHFYTQAGFYDVVLIGTSISTGQKCWDAHIFTVPAAADFYTASGCPNAAIQFEDRSTFVPTESIASWEWDFGDPASGAANTSTQTSPSHAYAAAGVYNVTLTITAGGGCQSTITRQVEVHPLPVIAFDLPQVTCEGTPLPFEALVPADVIDVAWQFGDAASGSADQSTSFSTFHAFSGPGNYDIDLFATSIFGCSDGIQQSISIDPNGMSGSISSIPTPPQVCEGDPVNLTAPAGGVSWSWSDGQTDETVDVSEEDVYSVTVTNAMGCEYTPDPVSVDIIPAPNAVISAVEYNEYGQPVGIFYNAYSTCEGEDVFLQIEGSPGYTYTWSNGDVGNETVFAEWRNNPLPVGEHDITVQVVDQTTGCTSTVGPFTVTVNALPAPFDIQSSASPACSGAPVTLTVPNPFAGLTYVWTTGESGTSIEVVLTGQYNVVAINNSGCRRESDTPVTVQPGPYLGAVPSGCHTQCKPDTICLPDLPGVVSYQWYFNGALVPGGTTADLPITESGTYYVEMVDWLGCIATSDPLNLDLYDGFGSIFGSVYMDVNENGIIDGPDTLVQNIGIELWENGLLVDGILSGPNGTYIFPNILSTDYTVQLDTNSIPGVATYYQIWQATASLVGCDDSEQLDWLLSPTCVATTGTLSLSACSGETIDFLGVSIPAGGSEVFMLQNYLGCDSTLTVAVDELFPDQVAIDLVGCEGEPVIYNGTTLMPGTQTTFTLTNTSGCDSLVTVTVQTLLADTTQVMLEVCPNETISYLGLTLEAGDEAEVLLTNIQGCDSLIQISVAGFPPASLEAASAPSCWNTGNGVINLTILQGNGPFLFSWNGNPPSGDLQYEGLAAGNYALEWTDGNDCTYADNVVVEAIPPIEGQVEVGAWDCRTGSAKIHASFLSGQGGIAWPDGTTGPWWEAKAPGMYSVEWSNDCETVKRSFEVLIAQDDGETPFYFPNIFSPNYDGVNDEFRGYAAAGVEVLSYELLVFDRWGNLLYQSEKLEGGWDGRYEVKDLDPGVYVYYMRATVLSCGQERSIFKEGDVTLIR
ncbi:MAG: PKD domain-containing protein [Lewinellaceae bacterium]|nr:PKD domain-containing protein [Lewinellaceae bacterium]